MRTRRRKRTLLTYPISTFHSSLTCLEIRSSSKMLLSQCFKPTTRTIWSLFIKSSATCFRSCTTLTPTKPQLRAWSTTLKMRPKDLWNLKVCHQRNSVPNEGCNKYARRLRKRGFRWRTKNTDWKTVRVTNGGGDETSSRHRSP